jgi:hypothetical protein|tara:strand:+ start:67 stop:426 length:360 start_codon:yes stop_codon:yes gene_type:complete
MKKNYLETNGHLLLKEGVEVVAKISLWNSQENSISKLFEYSENQRYKWNWSETHYSVSEENVSTVEISFIYFLNSKELKIFKSNFPISLLHMLRIETFNPDIYDYYEGKKYISKHDHTP